MPLTPSMGVTHTSPYQYALNIPFIRSRFGLFFRLFIVMGVTWTMEAVSWIISPNGWYFYVTDLANAIQGVVIFVLFVMKPKVKELIIKR